jgi:hypothetical protein
MIAAFLNATRRPTATTPTGISVATASTGRCLNEHDPWSQPSAIGATIRSSICKSLLEARRNTCTRARLEDGLLDRSAGSASPTSPTGIRSLRPRRHREEPSHTIDFDHDADRRAWPRGCAKLGARRQAADDGRTARSARDVSLARSWPVTLLLAKLWQRWCPEGGIWMNTQRPEWNDANNALVGNGLSVVTAAYLRRYIVFARVSLPATARRSASPASWRCCSTACRRSSTVTCRRWPQASTTGRGGRCSTRWARRPAPTATLSTNRASPATSLSSTGAPFSICWRWPLAYIDQTLRANRRADSLYHAYNILQLGDGIAAVEHLYEMLEGQVAILSSGLLAADESLALLTSLRRSHLYRADQHSYILYPDRELPGFLAKNCIPAAQVEGLALVDELTRRTDLTLLARDADGVYHFNGAFRNAGDVIAALERLRGDPTLATLVEQDGAALLQVFEATFHHRAFTGRSGTFFAFEGLGSIYWHMVSKLLLAAQEAFWQAVAAGANAATINGLATAYDDIRAGIGFNKSPATYGAFPTDPYSHTPKGKGAKQPGMTGQVKEEILTRFGELGVRVQAGAIEFHPLLLDQSEFSQQPAAFDYVAMDGQRRSLDLPANGLAFTLGQTPVVLVRRVKPQVEVIYADGQRKQIPGAVLEPAIAAHIFRRDGVIDHLVVTIAADQP